MRGGEFELALGLSRVLNVRASADMVCTAVSRRCERLDLWFLQLFFFSFSLCLNRDLALSVLQLTREPVVEVSLLCARYRSQGNPEPKDFFLKVCIKSLLEQQIISIFFTGPNKHC